MCKEVLKTMFQVLVGFHFSLEVWDIAITLTRGVEYWRGESLKENFKS
jgi:hypothetical protein